MKILNNRWIDNLRTVFVELNEQQKGRVVLTIGAGWFLSIGTRYIFPSVLPFLRSEFNFGLATSGLLLSSLWSAYAIGQFPGGLIGDRVGEGNVLVMSTAISTIAVLIVAISINIWMLFFGTIVFGLATALYGPTRFTIFTDIYDERAGTAVGLSHASGSIGNTILPGVAVSIATYSTWRVGYGVLIPAFICTIVGLWFYVPSHTSEIGSASTEEDVSFILRIIETIKREGIPVIVLIQILIGFASQGVLGFLPTYLIEVKGFSPAVAATLFGLYFAIGIFIQPVTGLSKDRFGSRGTLAVLIGLFSISLFALYFAQTKLQVAGTIVLLSHRNGTGVVTNTFVAETLPSDIKASGLGFLRTTWILIGASGPVFVGYLGNQGLLRQTFMMLAAIASAAALLSFYIPKEQS